jgi:RNA polymerase sigma-70 factor (ECF subfamily)
MSSLMMEARMRYDAAMVDSTDEQPGAGAIANEDSPLVARAQRGDMAAFEELVRKYRNQVYALSYHFMRDREEAWDISQEVFIKAHRSMAGFRGDASFKSWLLRITANHCKDQLKRRRLDVVPLDEALQTEGNGGPAGPDRRVEHSELGRAIEAAVAALPPKHQAAFILREYQGMSYEEMAKAMDCNLGTVMSRLHHARKKLQHALVTMGMVEGTHT